MAEETGAGRGLASYVGILGFSLFYAWNLSMIFWIAPRFALEQFGVNQLLPPTLYLAGSALGTVVMSQRAPSSGNWRRFGAFTVAFCLVGCVPEAISALDLLPRASFLAFGLFSVAAGYASVFFFYHWENVGLRTALGRPYYYVAFSFCAGAVVFLVLQLLFQESSDVVVLLCLVVSATLLLAVNRDSYGIDVTGVDDDEAARDAGGLQDDGPSAVPMPPRRSTLERFLDFGMLFALLAVCIGFALGVMMATDYRLVGAGMALGLLASLAILAYARTGAAALSIGRFEVVAISVVATCFIVVISLRSYEALAVCASLVCATWFVFRCFSADLLMRSAVERGESSAGYLALTKIAFNVGSPVGWGLACLMYATVPDVGQLSVLYAMVLVVLLVIVGFMRYPLSASLAAKRVSTSAAAGGVIGDPAVEAVVGPHGAASIQEYTAKCLKIADLYRLSPREGEVLCYLARGRSARHIAEDLMVSEHTAKSHIYRIYQKMDIHTKQDLIDLVESSAFDD